MTKAEFDRAVSKAVGTPVKTSVAHISDGKYILAHALKASATEVSGLRVDADPRGGVYAWLPINSAAEAWNFGNIDMVVRAARQLMGAEVSSVQPSVPEAQRTTGGIEWFDIRQPEG